MGIGLIITGLLFLFVPCISIYDFMPDFIGYLFILAGLNKMRVLDGYIEASYKSFVKLFFFNLCKNLLILPLISLHDETTVMLVNFVFSCVEVIFLWIASGELLEGMYYLSSRADSPAAERDFSGNRLLFRVFIIARAVLCVIPDLVVMTSDAYQSEVDIETNALGALYNYRNLILTACFIISAIIGLVFIIKISVYLSGIRRDGLTVPYIKKRYEDEYLNNEKLQTITSLKRGFFCIGVGLFFFSALQFYGIDILPDFVGLIFIAAGFGTAAKYVKNCRKYTLTASVAAVVSALCYAFNSYVSSVYYHQSYIKTDKAVLFYTLSACASAIGYIAIAAVFVCIVLFLYSVITDHTSPQTFNYSKYIITAKTKAAIIGSFGLLCCVIGTAMAFLYIYNEVFWVASAAVWLAYAIVYLKYQDSLFEEAEKKYM